MPDDISKVNEENSVAECQYDEVQEVTDGILRILARNPKDYTGTGTNTYVIGNETVWILDPGPADEHHVKAVLEAVAGRPVEGILITHTHLDHSPAAGALKTVTGAKTYGFGPLSADILDLTTEDVDRDFVPDVVLAHNRVVGEGDWCIQALHTPGHFPNHMCYFLPNRGILFSGDHVMGWSTTVIVPPLGSLADYMDSLDVLDGCRASLMLPSHGEAVVSPLKRIDEVREHRKMRHRQIKACLDKGVANPADIVELIYEGLTPRLIEAAKGSVMAHMELIDAEGQAGRNEVFTILSKISELPA